MTIPKEFVEFSGSFYQGGLEEAASFDAWIKSRINRMPANKRAKVKSYLQDLTNGKDNQDELQRAWASGTPAYGPAAKDLRKFLIGVLSLFPE